MEFIDYYQVLEVPKTASADDIRKAYRKLARKFHPDLNPNDAAAKLRFQQINEANEVLSDPDKRKKYDQYGKDWKHADEIEAARKRQQQYSGSFGGQPFNAGGFGGGQGDFSEFFESMFGGGATGRRQQGHTRYRGEDQEASLRLTLSDVYQTRKHTINLGNRQVRITIHAGAEDGQTIKLKGYGGPGINGGPNGDLYLSFQVENDTPFRREGSNLYLDQPLDLYTALLGGELVIDTLGGKVKLKVKPETQNDTTVRLSGKGFPVYRKEGQFGDLFVTYKIVLPSGLTDQERSLLEQLSKLRKP